MNTTVRVTLLLGALSFAASAAQAQQFGKNAVQYESFHFKILKTQHFDIYFYDKEAEAATEAGRMAERWYTRISTVLRHQLSGRQPLILYSDHPDFEQTNVAQVAGSEGVTESLKRRIVLPMGASLAETDHVIGHELTHAFQYDITGVGRGNVTTGLNRVPLWFIEGMAEYVSLGNVDPNTTMWMRDAVRTGSLPKFRDLENPRYFPYRWGQSFWSYLGGTYGDDIVGALLRAAGRTGNVQAAMEQMTHRPADSLIADWHRALIDAAKPVAVATGTPLPADRAQRDQARLTPVSTPGARALLSPGKEQHYNIAPALSPDGRRLAYISDAGLFSFDIYLADAENGHTIRKLVSATRDPHLESLQLVNSAGAWSADGRFVFGAVVTGKPALRIVKGDNGDLIKEIRFPNLGEILNPTWSPDGKMIAFSAQVGGLTDLFVYDLDSAQLRRLTDDPYADLEPAWSPDGSLIAFVTDRFTTSLDRLSYGNYQLAVIDPRVEGGGQIRQLPHLPSGKHINPQWSPDGKSLYFLGDPGGITNVYRMSLDGGDIAQVTNVFTGVSGITSLSPALSVAQKAPRAVFSVYSGGGYAIQAIDDIRALQGGPIVQLPPTAAALPPLERAEIGTAITALIRDPEPVPSVAAVSLSSAVKAYHPKLSLDFIAQPSLAVAADRFGTYIGGGATLYWSDMLGDHNLITMAQFQGRLSDFAALAAYVNRKSRLNWSVGIEQIPYIWGQIFAGQDPNTGLYVEEIERIKQTNRGFSGVAQYPFNRSDRVEVSAGLQQISYDHELQKHGFNLDGSVAFDSTIHFPVPPAVTLQTTSLALVHDNSYFGATSPILGDRWRVEVDPTFGGLQFMTALADYRKYVMPIRPFTFAVRALHIGRYGKDGEDNRFFPMFIGYSSFVRGYDRGSFQPSECAGGTAQDPCPVFDQLFGSRILVANAELRFPPFGLIGAGGGYYGILPIEAGIFYDAGVAWTTTDKAKFLGGTRNLVRSTGISFRMNLLGYAIGQMDIVHPFDRPGKNWMVRLSLTEGF
jgi:Tol biopolymer transport system component